MKFYKIFLFLVFCGLVSFANGQEKTAEIKQNREINYYLIEAKNAISQGNLQKAISYYTKCTILDKNCAVAHYELANVAIAVKDLGVALEHSRKAVAIAPKNAWYQMQLAEIYEARGMLAQAGETYVTLAKLERQKIAYLQKSEQLFEQIENWDKAIEVCDLLAKEKQNDFQILLKKQMLYTNAKRQDEGIAELKKLLRKNPKNSELYCLLAMSYKQNGDTKKAEKTYEKLLKLDSITSIAQTILFGHQMEQKKYTEAYNSLKLVLASGKINENVAVSAVLELQKNLNEEEQEKYLPTLSKLLITHYPENAVGYLFKAQEYREKEDYDTAKKHLEKALSITPTNYNGLAQLCIIQNFEKDWDALYETAKNGVKYYPQEHLFYIFKGLSASQKKEYLIAESSLQTGYLYAKEPAEKKDIQELLADVYYKNGKIEKSFELFEELIKENPDEIMLLNNYAYFLSLENKDLDRAEKLSKKTIDKEPENATYLDTYAWILFQQKKYTQALQFMEKAIKNLKKDEGSADMWEHYGDILFEVGKRAEAKKEWKKALALPDAESERLKKKIEEKN